MKRRMRSIVGPCVVVLVVGVVTFGSSVLLRSQTDALEARNHEAFSVADAEVQIERLDGLAWAQLAGRSLNNDAVQGVGNQARSSLLQARATVPTQGARNQIDRGLALLRQYVLALTNEQSGLRNSANPEAARSPEPHPEYPKILRVIAGLKATVSNEVAAVSDRQRVMSFSVAAVDFGIVLVLMSVYVSMRRRATRREIAGAADARYRALVQEAPDMVLVLDGEGCIRYQSPSASRILGKPVEAIAGASLVQFLHPDDATELGRVTAGLLSDAPVTLEIRVIDVVEGWRTVMATVANRLDDPLIEGFVVNAHDVTESRRLADQLRQSTKLQAVGQLAGGVAHDFNNILCVIRSYAELLEDEVRSETGEQDLAEILAAADRGANLARQILTFSRVEANAVEVLDLNERVSGLRDLLERTIDESCELSLVTAPGTLGVAVDPTGIDQVMLNLVINSRDSVDRHGLIEVVTERVTYRAGDKETHDLAPGDYAVLKVRDNGVGMNDEVLARVFEPFFTTKEAGGGTGLGLATVYGVVKRAGGHIAIESTPGVGTDVCVWFPVASEPPITKKPVAVTPVPRRDEVVRVLLVEDEDAVRNAFARILSGAGHVVRACENGPAALSVIESYEFDVLVTDMVMPGGIDGHELATTVRAQRPDVDVVYVSGYSETAVRNQGFIEVGVPLLQKPVTSGALLAAVQARR